MVCSDLERFSIQVVMEVLDRFHYNKKLPSSDAVTAFCRTEDFTIITDNPFCAILDLG